MKLLLDTHALLWFYLDDPNLSATAKSAIVDPQHDKLVSPASYWEIAIKISLGKYRLNESFDEFIQHAIFDNGFAILAIEPKHASVVISLPFHHKDPFDRMLVAQSMVENICVVSADTILDKYGIRRLW